MFEIEFYKLKDGTVPVEEFLNGLDVKMRVKAVNSIAILMEFGNNLREPYSKALGEGLFELRIKFSSDISRIFYFFQIGNRIVLTNGFIKKSPKTPKEELKKARQYMADYKQRTLK